MKAWLYLCVAVTSLVAQQCVYGPLPYHLTALLAIAACYLLAKEGRGPGSNVVAAVALAASIALRLALGAAHPHDRAFVHSVYIDDIAVVCATLLLCRSLGRHPLWVAVYGLNPLTLGLLGEVSGAGDVALRFVAILALALLAAPRPSQLRSALGLAVLALAATGQPVLLAWFPLLCTRRNLIYVCVAVLAVVAYSAGTELSWWENATTEVWQQTGFVSGLLSSVVGPRWAVWLTSVIFAGGLLAYWATSHAHEDRFRSLVRVWMAFYLCAPVVSPDGLLMLAPLLVILPSRAWLFACGMHGVLFWGGDHHVAEVAHGILALLIANDLVGKRFATGVRRLPPGTWSVIVPTLNEGERIRTCLGSIDVAVRKLSAVMELRGITGPSVEVLVADCGSEDGTTDAARELGARVLEHAPRGRGQQIRAGVAASTGDLVIVLHADAVCDGDGMVVLYDEFLARPRLEWGIFGARFDHRTSQLRLIEFLNAVRFYTVGISFGDQGLFVRREILEAAGGVPEIPLMEDVELALRLKAFPNSWHVGRALLVSARRWETRDMLQSSSHVIRICFEYLVRRRLGTDVSVLSKRMYAEYYGRSVEG